MTTRLSFRSGDEECAAWLTLPDGEGPHPVVLLVHGGGATHAMILDQYEQRFTVAGFAVLAFDFRHLGESGGEPRQLMSLKRYFEDIDAALAFIRTRPELDANRIALWGTSFGASHVVATAARRADIAAAVVQCPVLTGRAPALSAGFLHLLRLTGPIVSDLMRGALGLPRRYVPIVGRPGERAFVNLPGAYEGWYSVVPKGYAFDPRVQAAAEQALKLAPANPNVQDTLGWILVQTNQTARGLDLLRRAAAAAPKSGSIRYHYAAALARSGDKARARAELQKLLADTPTFPETQAAKALLNSL